MIVKDVMADKTVEAQVQVGDLSCADKIIESLNDKYNVDLTSARDEIAKHIANRRAGLI
jgi:hypothetical protein